MRFHSMEREPPPQILERGTESPSPFATSKESRMGERHALQHGLRHIRTAVSIVIPTNIARALVSLIGLRSPIRYGRKYT